MKLHADSTIGKVSLGRYEIQFHDTGKPNDPGTPIVLVHGTGGSTGSHFRTVFPMLAARHRVIGVDLQVDIDTDLEVLVSQVAAVLKERVGRDQSVHLVGYSLGAVVAALVAARNPVRIATLTLVAGWLVTDKQQRLRHQLWHRLFRDNCLSALREFQTFAAYSPKFLRGKSDADLQTLVDTREFRDGIDIEMSINSSVDLRQDIESITAPTLVIGCTEDQMVPIVHSYMLFGGIQNARLAEIDAGHAVTIERPAQIFMLIDNFVGDPDRYPAGSKVDELTI